MRRRDATDHSLFYSVCRVDRQTVVSFAVALGVHAALLAILSVCVFHVAEPAPLIMVSLVASGGGGGRTQPAAAATAAAGRRVHPAARTPEGSADTTSASEQARSRQPLRSRRRRPPTRNRHPPRTRADRRSAVPAAGRLRVSVPATGWAGPVAALGVGSGDGTGPGDQRARCIVCPEPSYPLVARRHGWQGTVEVGVSLLADGSVAAADVRRSCGYEVLDREAVAVARRSRFTPLGAGPARGHIAYRFELIAPRP